MIGKCEMVGIKDVKGIIFDCYNTLIKIRTDEDDIATYQPVSKWLMYKGVRITPEDLLKEYKSSIDAEMKARWEKYPEVRVEHILGHICKQHELWDINEEAVGIEAARAFRAWSIREIGAFQQSERLLKELEDYPKVILSNGQRVFSELELKYFGLFDKFKMVIFSSDFGYKKPDPRIFLEAAKMLGFEPENILCIGDNFENDIVPSAKLGMKALHIEEAWKLFSVY
ncbi:MAG: HAD family hydrolase [Methanotrichaceae archaeon]